MRASILVFAFAFFVSLVSSAGFVQAANYDIRAELQYMPQGSGFWVVQIRNVGPTIPGPVRSEFRLAIPAGAKIVNWTLNGWQCAPSPPLLGSATISCQITLGGAWAAGTILSNQLFHTAPPKKAGAVPLRACIRALFLLPDASGNFQPAPETTTANNSACA